MEKFVPEKSDRAIINKHMHFYTNGNADFSHFIDYSDYIGRVSRETHEKQLALSRKISNRNNFLTDTYKSLLIYYYYLDGWRVIITPDGGISLKKRIKSPANNN